MQKHCPTVYLGEAKWGFSDWPLWEGLDVAYSLRTVKPFPSAHIDSSRLFKKWIMTGHATGTVWSADVPLSGGLGIRGLGRDMTLIRALINTKRLLLRPETEADTELIYTMNTDPEVMRFVGRGEPWTSPLDEFRGQHRETLARIAHESWGNVSVLSKETGRYIGWCGLTPEPQLGQMQLSYRFFQTAWGQGFATEAASAVLAVGFESMGLDEVVATVHPDNTASIRVLKKLAMTYTRDMFHDRADRDVRVYSIQGNTWNQQAKVSS